MPKTLVVAEKPSVARDLAGALPGSFTQAKDKASLEGDDYVITWAVGHLVGLAEPDKYDPKLKKWRFADLPIVPEKFQLVPNDDKAKKQLGVIHRQMARDEVETVINACDAGREGELIFAYVYETAKTKKPVQRLWLSSMTRRAIEEAFGRLRDGEEMRSLEDAARSRSEADWVVGMNATRAASIRLRAAFDGAVSLGRVQTPTLALVARREVEIREFKPEPYWLVEALFAASGERTYFARYMGGKRITEDEAARIVEDAKGKSGVITKLETKEETERAQLLYDLTSLQRHANTLHGFSARRTLSAAQKLYEEHKALTYPRTNSRFVTGDMIEEIKPIAELVGHNPAYKKGADYVVGLDDLPLGRVVNDAKVQDHHAIIPTKSEHDLGRMGADELKIYDLVAKRFLAIFHPDAKFERTRVETTVAEHVFRTSGRVLVEAGWRAVYGEEARTQDKPEDDSGGDQRLPKLEQGEDAETREMESLRKETQPPRRFTEASLLAAMESAGKEIEDEELREAMKDSGIGTPATRASIIERLISVAYIEREGRALIATEKGVQVIRLLGEHQLTSAWPHRRLGAPPGPDRARRGLSPGLHEGHREVHLRDGRGAGQAQGRADRAGQARSMPGVWPRGGGEPQGLLLLVQGGPRLRLRDLEAEGAQEPPGLSGQGADGVAQGVPRARRPAAGGSHRQAGDRLQGPFRAAASAPSSRSNRARTSRASGRSTSTRTGPPASRRPRARARAPARPRPRTPSRSAPTQWPPRPADHPQAQRGTTRNTRPVRLTAYNRPTPSSPKDASAFTRNPSSRSPTARGRRSRAVRTRPVQSSA